jgi:putative membrane protein
VRYGGFSVLRQGDEIIVQYGLFSRQMYQFHISRIQFITVSQNPIRELLGKAEVSVHIATAAVGKSGDLAVKLAPYIDVSRVCEFLSKTGNLLEYPPVLSSLPRRALLGYILRPLLVSAVLIFLALQFFSDFFVVEVLGSSWIVWGPLLLVFALAGRIAWWRAGYALAGNVAVLREGVWTFETHIISRDRVVVAKLIQFFFQRPAKLCKVAIRNAGATSALKLRGMDEAEAARMLNWCAKN